MRLSRTTWVKLAIFAAVSIAAAAITLVDYVRVSTLIPTLGHYSVTLHLPQSGGLYPRSNVTYRGTEVGRVQELRVTPTGVDAVLSLKSDVPIPSNLDAQVHSQSAVGEQFVQLLPRDATSTPLRQGDVIAVERTSVPPDIDSLLDAANTALAAIPRDNLKTVVDESYTAVGGLGPELSRIIKGGSKLAIDAASNVDALTTVIDKSSPVLDSQTDTADAIKTWSASLADVTRQLHQQDTPLAHLLLRGGPAADEGRELFDRLQPTLPQLLPDLLGVGDVAVTYQQDVEQVLVTLPQGTAIVGGALVPDVNTQHRGVYLDFLLNLGLPPACTTGFLPPQQQRSFAAVDAPPLPEGDLYCRIPQDSYNGVRAARNYPCETVPGKRAPTVKMCESDESYVPLNDGNNWKGDSNATLSGQPVPQLPPPGPHATAQRPETAQPNAPPPTPPIPAALYDQTGGPNAGPNGQIHNQPDVTHSAKDQTWQSMLMPPNGN